MNQLLDGVDDLIRQTVASKLVKAGQPVTAAQAMFSKDIEALRLFLEGEERRRIGKYEEASRLYYGALERDSTMAITWLRLWQVCSWSFVCGSSETELLPNAMKYSSDLPPKIGDYIKASADWRSYQAMDHEQNVKDLIERYGESTDLMTLLGEVVFHSHISRERPAIEALPYFLKAFEYDPGNVEVLNHVIQLLVYEMDANALNEIIKKIPRGSVNWSAAKAAYLTCREGDWTDEEIQEILDDPGFSIDAIFLRCPGENTLDRFSQLFDDLERLNGRRFSEREAPIHALIPLWRGQLAVSRNEMANGQFAALTQYGTSLSYLGLEFDGLEEMLMNDQSKLRSGNIGPWPDDFQLALIAAYQNDEDAFNHHFGVLQELSGEEQTYVRSMLTAQGYWLHQQGDYIKSNEILDSAVTAYGRPLPGLMNAFMTGAITMVQAENYYALGEMQKALLYHTIMFDVMEAGDDDKVGYSWLRRGEIHAELGNDEESLEYFNRFLRMFENSDPSFEPWIARAAQGREEVFKRLD